MREDEFGFAPPPFKPAEALTGLKRSLREIKGLKERGAGFDFGAHQAVVLGIDGGSLRVQLAKKPARSPSWEARELSSSADIRDWLSTVKQRVAAWTDDD